MGGGIAGFVPLDRPLRFRYCYMYVGIEKSRNCLTTIIDRDTHTDRETDIQRDA